MSLLEKVKLIEDVLIDMSKNQHLIYEELEKIHAKLDRLLVSREFVFKNKTIEQKEKEGVLNSPGFKPYEPLPANATTNFALPKTGKYQWYVLKNDRAIKLRKCSNEGCPMFLKFNEDKRKYEHWKYDANTGVGGYVQDTCDYYEVFG